MPRRERPHPSATIREAALAKLVADVLYEYEADIRVHACDSCMVNVGIFKRRAEQLGVTMQERV